MFNKNKIIGFNTELEKFYCKVGDILHVKYESEYNWKSVKKFRGICISKKNKGNNTKIILRNVIDNICVEYDFFLYGGNILEIKRKPLQKNINTKRGKLYFLRKQNMNQSKVN